jgi:hypothetical protein
VRLRLRRIDSCGFWVSHSGMRDCFTSFFKWHRIRVKIQSLNLASDQADFLNLDVLLAQGLQRFGSAAITCGRMAPAPL